MFPRLFSNEFNELALYPAQLGDPDIFGATECCMVSVGLAWATAESRSAGASARKVLFLK
jgi:hypothetical protein